MSGGIYLRGGNYYLDFTFHGKRIRKMYGPSRKGASEAISKIKSEIAENKFLDKRKEPPKVSFHDFAKQYLEWVRANRKPTSYQGTLSKMRKLDAEFGAKLMGEINVWLIEKYKAKRKEDVKGQRKEKLKPATVNREIALLKTMFTKAIEWGIVKDNPAKKVKLLKGEVRRLRFLMPDEVQLLLSKCEDWVRPIVIIAVNTGARKGELLNLRWSEVDFQQGIITLLDTKNGERRDVPMNETARGTLSGIEDQEGHVFKKGGKPLKYFGVRKPFEKAVRESKIEDFRFHDLRHTFASLLVMSGVDLNVVRDLLGHKTLEMTLRYAHLSPDHKAKAINVLDKVVGQGMALDSPQEQPKKKVISLTR